jgi:hypothetical protein
MKAGGGGAANKSKATYSQVFSGYILGLKPWYYLKENVKVTSHFYTMKYLPLFSASLGYSLGYENVGTF